MKSTLKLAVVAVIAISCGAQDRSLAPRSTLLTGTAEQPSASGEYVVTFPAPNECVELHVRSTSRTSALYTAVSRGGFSLLPGRGGLTVWTSEEWGEAEREFKNEDWAKAAKARCAAAKQ